MKLNELKEALARDDMIADRAKTDFIEKVVTELGKIADKSAISNPATQQSTSIPAQPSSTQQATPPNNVAQQAAQIRQQKLKAGGQAAQTQMAQNSVTPPNNVAQQAAQTRQQKLAIAANTAQAGMTPVRKPAAAAEQTPAQVRQQKLAIAANTAQAGMTPVRKPAVWRSGRNPNAPATRENTTFDKLNKIFESMLYVDEDTSQPGVPLSNGTISDLVSYYFVKLMNSPIFSNDESKNKISQFAKEVEQSYPTDKGRAALQQMGEWAWETFENNKQQRNASRLGAQSKIQSTQQTNPAAQQTNPAAQQTNPAADQQSTVGVRQINKIIPTLRKRDLLSVKKNVDNTLAGRGGTVAAPAATSSAAPAKDNIISMPKGKAGQVRASREGGVTPEEQAKFDQRVQAAMASQK